MAPDDVTKGGADAQPPGRPRADDLVAIMPLKDWSCVSCGARGGLLMMGDEGPLCLGCVELDHLVFLPAGDAALTRRAKRASRLSAVVVRFSRARRRYERQGVLVEEPALEQAEANCLADAERRARRRAEADASDAPPPDADSRTGRSSSQSPHPSATAIPPTTTC